MGILMVRRILLIGMLLATSLATQAGEPSSRVSMDPELLSKLRKADAGKGKEIALTCGACHDAGGAVPNLDGQLATYLFKQLQDYKDGHRENAVMSGIAATLSEEEMINVSAHYAEKVPQVKSPGKIETPRLVSKGDSRRILPPCAVCHDARGTGQKLDIPALAAQSEVYLAQTLRDYQNNVRHNDLYGRMRSIAKLMTDQEISEIAHYYANMGR